MGREIKFRGKCLDNGAWVFGLIQHISPMNTLGIEFMIDRKEVYSVEEVDPATVGQYTGLKDKNGIEIYEGDVCKGKYGEVVYKNEVIFVEGGFSIRHSNDEYGCCALLNEHENKEVIGNIHDNPDLLKEVTP